MKEEHAIEDRVLQALHALAKNDREREAPLEVEARLLAAFRSRRRSGWRWAAITATAAALVIALLPWPSRRPKQLVSTAPPISQAPAASRPAPVAIAPANVTRTPRKLARKVAALPQPQAREVVTDFFPLMNPAPSFERGQILRVQLPAAAMQTVGLPVREEHLGDLVQADVLVGEEGIPRAIRFVRFDVK
jgi:hypothetical protein